MLLENKIGAAMPKKAEKKEEVKQPEPLPFNIHNMRLYMHQTVTIVDRNGNEDAPFVGDRVVIVSTDEVKLIGANERHRFRISGNNKFRP